jgi:hypothetical protein
MVIWVMIGWFYILTQKIDTMIKNLLKSPFLFPIN